MRARLFTSIIFSAIAIALMSTVGAQESVPLSAPKPHSQTGFPAQLYSWVIPADNPQTPEKVELGNASSFSTIVSRPITRCRATSATRPPRDSPISSRPRWGSITPSDSATPRPC